MQVDTVAKDSPIIRLELEELRKVIVDADLKADSVKDPNTSAKVADLLSGYKLSPLDKEFIALELHLAAWNSKDYHRAGPEAPTLPGVTPEKRLVMKLDDIVSRQYDPTRDGIPVTDTTPKVTSHQPVQSLAAATDPKQPEPHEAQLGTTNALRGKIDKWRQELAATAKD